MCNIMAAGFRFMPLGLEPFGSVHGCNINICVHARAERTCHSEMSQ